MRPTIVASLVPRAFPVLAGFAATGVRSFFVVPIRGTEAATAEHLAAAAGPEIEITSDAYGFAAFDGGAIDEEAHARWNAIAAHPAYRAAVDALPQAEQHELPPNLARIAPQAFADAISLIDVLDDLATRTDIRGVLVSEDASSATRTLVRWARARGIPSLQLTHGASPLYTLFSSRFLVDDHYVYGPHIAPSMTDAGVRDDQLHIGTFYGHDEHRTPGASTRQTFRAAHGIADDTVVIALALGFNAYLTTFEPDGFWCLNVLTAFVEAVRLLRERGLACTPLIKHRWYDPQVADLTRKTAAFFDLDVAYFDGTMAEVLPAVDVLCASDSNTTIEAMFYERAVLDIVYPWHWHIGPQYAQADAIPYVDARYPAQIADALAPLVEAAARRRQVEGRREPFRATVADRTRDAAGIARDVLAIFDRRRATLAAPSPAQAGAPLAVHPRAQNATVDTGYAIARSDDPAAQLAELRRVIAPGGRLVAQFPNARNLRYLKDVLENQRWSQRRIGRDSNATPATVRDVIALLESSGFAVEAIRFNDDRALAQLDAGIAGESNVKLGDLTVYGMSADDVREARASHFTITARRAS